MFSSPLPVSRTCWSQIPSMSLRERGIETQLLQCESSFLLITVSEIGIDECSSSVQSHSHHTHCFILFFGTKTFRSPFLSFSTCPCFPKHINGRIWNNLKDDVRRARSKYFYRVQKCNNTETFLFFAVTTIRVSLPSAVPLLCHPLKKKCRPY